MEIKRCTRCVMDDSNDNYIHFDENGICNYCSDALALKKHVYFPNTEGDTKLNNLVSDLKTKGKGKKYDCLMGISGGLDSSYLAYLGYKWGLRILAVHIDDGFDTKIATENIRKLCDACKIELITIKPDAEQFNDLTKAFIMAEVSNIAIPQDNILFAYLYHYAKKYKINTFLSGGNFSLESILKQDGGSNAYDLSFIRDIHKKYGTKAIDKLIFLSNFRRMTDKYIYRIKSVRPLNYINYNKERALKELQDFCGFEYYGAKHCENTFTKIAQLYWLVEKFKNDKRTSHFSSMIISDQMSRDDAMLELQKPLYNDIEINQEIKFVLSELGLTVDEFNAIIKRPGKKDSEYKTSLSYKLVKKIFKKTLLKLKG
jgi:N-acetyl sugar amidotransferase